MKLSALARESGVSTASIKYYIHVGILRPGLKRNATTSDYSQAHVDRLGLITCLRRELSSPIESIAALTRAIDDESLENIELMGICQRLALEASNVLKSAAGSSSPSEPEPEPAPKTIENDIRDILQELGWPDISPTAVASMAGVLEELSDSGYPVGRDTILRHIQALAEIAARNTTPITDSLSRDRICVEVVRGITMHNRLLVATSALVHASLSAMPRSPQS
ncbi:MerR family transcriptional regulator [Brevibacterium sp. UCMA 11754]|uniref:MerR family transcriptional regulator n=1 Tax=Brevibacterium sp. UCMA 11754 TaxID=2749198 RepID=UPI001F42E981|nr:MerR family transcriptional regulator [Brevibacterium sp. UCMA 11754]MCF2574024.1 MerR family transcriptional regulator [Brevibacterium sp. UCMA 11754]